ncbi:MAG TPA: hypothetical protein DCM73_10615 [Clostridiales bacterium]|nr:hypothetical protein [Clostridiales bacterium]
MGNVVLVGSQKSGIGKTIVCIKTGITLSEGGKKVLLMDLSAGKKKISEYLNVNEDIIYDIRDVMDATCSLEQAAIVISDKLSLLPCPRIAGKLNDIKIEAFTKLVNDAKDVYDIVIADIDKVALSYIDFDLVSHVISVNNNDFSCIKEFNGDKKIAQKFGVDSILAVLNRYNRKNARKGTMMKLKDIQKMTEMAMDVIIDENSKYSETGYDFLFAKEENSFNKAVNTISAKLSEEVQPVQAAY